MKIFLKLLLFITLMGFAPSIYIIFVAGGTLPPVFYLYFLLGADGQGIAIMWLVHLIIYSVIFFAIAYFFVEFLYKKFDKSKTITIYFFVVMGIVLFSFVPVYSVGGHNSAKTANIISVYKSAGSISYLPW